MGVPYAEVIGDPIAHSKSPLIHNFWLEQLGIEGTFRATRVHSNDLPDYLSKRRRDPDWRGCSVTLPHKVKIISLLDAFTPRATAIGAVNCVYLGRQGLIGTNTDADGIEEVLQRHEWQGNFATVIGAGGAARAALEIFRGRDTLEVMMIVRSPEDVRPMHAAFVRSGGIHSFDDIGAALAGSSCVINATPLGMAGMPAMPSTVLDGLRKVGRKGLVFDMVYAPPETELLKRARSLALETADGLELLLGQARQAFTHFFGMRPPADLELPSRELLGQ